MNYQVPANTATGQAGVVVANGSSGGNPVANPISLGSATDKTYLFPFGTGIRNAALSNVHATIDRLDASVTFAGPQSAFLGLDQVNVLVPPSSPERAKSRFSSPLTALPPIR